MLKSDAERAIRKAIEENEAEFTEEQIKALSAMILKISSTIVEEAFASWKPGSGGRPQFFA
ncbi:hypothetical protein KF707_15905 [Candidatus Obscuribacterales bacterium]|jgi:hypothetical protein|nr:hypothetical protein [Candidatus Obscuribacterales bacterium]MBX3152083.1 hypothetical protein [Candidatus Obscuribacterales bacterium]